MSVFTQWFGNGEQSEQFLLALAVFTGLVLWMAAQKLKTVGRAFKRVFGGPRHNHPGQVIDTGHGQVRLELDESGLTSRFRLYPETGSNWRAEDVLVEMSSPDGSHQVFGLPFRAGFSLSGIHTCRLANTSLTTCSRVSLSSPPGL